ncbi:hypothetical protein GGI11_000347 [Coemansia sp. RSA 2049]|nr:hypothetical protein GGI11_000347 [Coemansia sp. RSA 2049]
METGRLWMLTSAGWPSIIAAVFYLASSFAALVLHVSYALRSNAALDILLLYWPTSTAVSLLALHFSLKVSLADRTGRALCAGAVYIVLGMMAFILELKSDSLQQSIFLADNERSDNSTLDRIGGNIITRLAFTWVTPAPLILQQIIKFFHGYGTDSSLTLGDGLFLAFSMGVVEVVRAVTYQRYWHILMKTYLWLLKVLSALVYRKVLHLSNKSKTQHTTGELVSYQSVDIDNLTLAVNYVHCIWDYPLKIIIILLLLYWNIGWSCFAGVAIVVLGTYLGTLVLKYVKVHVAELFENRDERMRLVFEMLTNMKSIKLYSWQNLFLRKIDSLRNRKELSALQKLAASNGMLTFVSSLTTISVGFATFFVYEIFDGTSHGPLTSQLIFALLSLFVLIREPITEGMTVFSVLINAHRSYLRISSLALSEEVGSHRVGLANHICGSSALKRKETFVKVKNGTFGWLSSDEPSLTDINIECKRDELVAVVGRVGSGKSSLVSAVLGDMVKSKGSVTVQGAIAYVPQQAWIMNATLRDNILFGHRLDQEFYDKVIDACALRPDLRILPSGDMTEIGEKGINLSGGQRARVSLARAVYARADVYILDDPLAAVDAHVGKHLYSRVIGPNGLLKSRARILVTNAVQYLNTANSIYMLENGRIVDYGTVAKANQVIEDNRPKDSWPEQGVVEFKNYSTRYREGLDLALENISFRVMPRQKVGIVGRTGSGKTSLTLALFRIIEAAEGKILIDGEDIFKYGLFDVRSKLSIIPQDPVLFAGTVRENLDPFGSYPDQEIWNALQHAHLAEYIRTKEEGLEFEVMQNGSNFSVGQRQLICLARALLKRAKVLVLDEATAAIDNSTDAIIQESIRKEFKDCTVLTIAHRLNTITNSDMILVLDNGKITGYDTPQNLLDKRDSLFFKLVEEAGINNHVNANI